MSYHHPHTPQSPSFSPGDSVALSSANTSMTSVTTALPTPAHSVNGSASQNTDLTHDMMMMDESPQKRKRAIDDTGDREQKKVHIEDRKVSMDDLHMDVGEKYLLCRTPHRPSRPKLTHDLFELYNLTGLAAEVAREKPNGEKNALRKTYKGQIKRLGIAGHFDAVKHYKDEKEREDPRKRETDFLNILSRPAEDWQNVMVKGNDIEGGLSDLTLAALGKAMTMSRGKITLPTSKWDPSVLGDLAPSDSSRQASVKATAPSTPAATTPAATNRPRPQQSQTAVPGQDPARPKRNIKKRSYGDSSFEGYGEGFPDDDLGMDTGYSSGGGDDRGGLKRRKKNPGSAQPQFPGPMRPQTYGPGMVGA